MDRQSFEALLSTGEFEAPERPPTLDTITAADLQKKDLPPIKFIVDKLLSVGLNTLDIRLQRCYSGIRSAK